MIAVEADAVTSEADAIAAQADVATVEAYAIAVEADAVTVEADAVAVKADAAVGPPVWLSWTLPAELDLVIILRLVLVAVCFGWWSDLVLRIVEAAAVSASACNLALASIAANIS